jgi:pyrroline-5-carboxylate reductase
MRDQRITFIGTGQMARAIGRGLVEGRLVEGSRISGCDPDAAACEQFLADVSGACISPSNRDAVVEADVVVLAVKPQVLAAVTRDLAPVVQDQLIVSVAAGVQIAQLAEDLGTQRIIRVMPNTPCLLGQGACAFAVGQAVTSQDRQAVATMLRAIGFVAEVEEKYLDAVTGLSGSGPAFIYLVIEALSDGGVRAGLPRQLATQLAAHTVRGAAQMVIETELHPAELKDRVTSPGGTTIAGVRALEQHAARSAFIAAVEAATERARQLGGAS